MKTLLEYLCIKLKDIHETIEKKQKQIIEYAKNQDYSHINAIVLDLNTAIEQKNKLTEDACKYLFCEQLKEIPKEMMSIQTISSYFRYTSYGVTINERDMLVNHFGYQMREIKIR
jgi:hypothetical protein